MRGRNEENRTEKRQAASINWNWIAGLACVLLLSWLAASQGYRIQFTFESNQISSKTASP